MLNPSVSLIAVSRYWKILTYIFLCFSLGVVSSADNAKSKPSALTGTQKVYYAGLRRSSYSMEKKHRELCSDHKWWADRAKAFAAGLSGDGRKFKPVIIEIVCIYLDGTCEMEFLEPDGIDTSVKGIKWFNPKASINHETALETYDKEGVNAIIQIEPGSADVTKCLEIVHKKFGHHKCVIGYGVDAEWYFTKGSKQNSGRPITDKEASEWTKKVLSFNSSYLIFLKHWETAHMPPHYRNPQLFFVSDSMGFKNQQQLMKDFKDWGSTFKNSAVGFQFGYKKDFKWWKKLKNPPSEISGEILKGIPNTRYLFWVDFTADQVTFSSDPDKGDK